MFIDPHPDMARIVEILRRHNVRKVLDLGCGTGRHIVYLTKRGFQVYALDSSAVALSHAESWLKDEGLTASLTRGRMEEDLPYSDEFFDAVVSVQVIHHNLIESVLRTIGEITRVLKPGGVVFVTVPILTVGPIQKEMDWQLQEVEPRTFIPGRGPEAGIPHHYFTEESLKAAFSEYNVQELYVDDTNHRCLLGIKNES